MSKMMSVQFASSSIVKSAGTLYSVVRGGLSAAGLTNRSPNDARHRTSAVPGHMAMRVPRFAERAYQAYLNTAPRLGEVSTEPAGRYVKLVGVTSIQVADQTFVAAAPNPRAGGSVTRRRGGAGGRTCGWKWSGQGAQGVRWRVSGPLTGTMEIWCEEVLDGFVLHYFLHAEPVAQLPADPSRLMGVLADLNKSRRVAGKVMSFEVKDRLERGREVSPRPPGPRNGRQDAAVHRHRRRSGTDPGGDRGLPAVPGWVSAARSVEVLDTLADGRAAQVRFDLDVGILQDTYVLACEWAAGGDECRGGWSAATCSVTNVAAMCSASRVPGSTKVTYELMVDLLVPMIGQLKRRAEKAITDTALNELKKRSKADRSDAHPHRPRARGVRGVVGGGRRGAEPGACAPFGCCGI